METVAVTALNRSTTGKGAARKSRKAGQTPGVVYRAGGTATPVNFNVAELAAVFRKTGNPNTIISLDVDGAPHTCLVRDMQRHPVTRSVIHVDFYEVDADYMVTVDVAVATVGRAQGTRSGGTLRVITRSLTVKCPAGKIPAKLEIDVTPLEVGAFIKASEVPTPDGCVILVRQDFNVVTVEGKVAPVEAAPADGAAAAAGAKAAPGKAAAAKAPAAKAAPAAAAKAPEKKK